MICEKCRAREAEYHYSSVINGAKSSTWLCADCARSEQIGFNPSELIGNFFSNPFLGLNNYGYAASMPPRTQNNYMPRFLTTHFVMPEYYVWNVTPSRERTSENSANIPDDAGEEIRAARELAALEYQMEAAIKAEDYEKASMLRDRIRGAKG